VYRGGSYERLGDFETRMLERYPRAELLRSLGVPSEEIRLSNKQCKYLFDKSTIFSTVHMKHELPVV